MTSVRCATSSLLAAERQPAVRTLDRVGRECRAATGTVVARAPLAGVPVGQVRPLRPRELGVDAGRFGTVFWTDEDVAPDRAEPATLDRVVLAAQQLDPAPGVRRRGR